MTTTSHFVILTSYFVTYIIVIFYDIGMTICDIYITFCDMESHAVLLCQSEIGFGKLESYTKLDKLGEVSDMTYIQ